MKYILSFLATSYGKKATAYYGTPFFKLIARYFFPYAPACVIDYFIEPMVKTAFTQVFITAIIPGVFAFGIPTGFSIGLLTKRKPVSNGEIWAPVGKIVDDDYVLL